MFRILGTVFSSVAFGVAISEHVQKRYPAKGNPELRSGNPISIGHETYYVVGYFGAKKAVLDEGIDPERGLYYGPKAIAQKYAQLGRGIGQVGVVVAKRLPGREDHAMGRFDTFEPLSPRFCIEADVKVIHPEVVDHETSIGFFSSVKRMADQHFNFNIEEQKVKSETEFARSLQREEQMRHMQMRERQSSSLEAQKTIQQEKKDKGLVSNIKPIVKPHHSHSIHPKMRHAHVHFKHHHHSSKHPPLHK